MVRVDNLASPRNGTSTGIFQVSPVVSSPAMTPRPPRSPAPARSMGQADCVHMDRFTSSPLGLATVPAAHGSSLPGGTFNVKVGPSRSPGPLSPRSVGSTTSADSGSAPGQLRPPNVEAGALLWIPCEKQVWRAGLVLGHNNELVNNCWKRRAIVEVQGDQGKEHKIVDVDAAPIRGRPTYLLRSGELLSMQGAKTVKDLNMLPSIGEPEILHALRLRYASKNIYTFAGPMLLAVNPFEDIPSLYDSAQLQKFTNLPHGSPRPAPHVFAIAREALLSIQHSNQSQTVLVSGESGAGKTESAKFVMRFLALADGCKPQAAQLSVQQRVFESVPLLEALGNARTSKNDNSSRFGKYVELNFQQKPGCLGPCIMDAVTHTYLLETVRVTELREGERCFHIFYQIVAAAARAKRMMLAESVAHGASNILTAIPECSMNNQHVPLTSALPCLMLPDHCEWNPQRFSYLARSSYQWRMPWADEAKQFDRTLEAMRAFNLTDDEISQVISAILAVLHLGNINFQCLPENSEASTVDDSSESGPLGLASELLGVSSEDLSTAFCTRVIQVYGKSAAQVVRRGRTVSQAGDCRDALARHLYGLVFAYIVARINGATSGRGNSTTLPSIGVLDIFGFEVFEKNCFEQLCINFTNEILQHHFSTVTIDQELALYKAEGIQCNLHEGTLQTAVAQKRMNDSGIYPGIFPMLDDECRVAGGSAESWLNKVCRKYGDSRILQLAPKRKGHFVLQHFAGPVEYCADAFLSKNRDTLSVEALECMQESSKTVLRQQFNAHGHKFGHNLSLSGRVLRKKVHSVSSDFQVQLDRLMKNIQATRPHFIRCMKPNQIGAADLFDSFSILQQLRCQGVQDGLRIARAGYSFRLCHQKAVLTYRALAPRNLRRTINELVKRGLLEEAARVLVSHLQDTVSEIPSTSIQVGKSMTFFNTAATDLLGIHVHRHREIAAVQIQVSWRASNRARRFAATRKAALMLQRVERGRRVRSAHRSSRNAAKSQHSSFESIIDAVLVLQRFFKRVSVNRTLRSGSNSASSEASAVMPSSRSSQFTSQTLLSSSHSTPIDALSLMSSNRSYATAFTDGSDNVVPSSRASTKETTEHEPSVENFMNKPPKVAGSDLPTPPPLFIDSSYRLQTSSMQESAENLLDSKLLTRDSSMKTILSHSCCDDADDDLSISSSQYPPSGILPVGYGNQSMQEGWPRRQDSDSCASLHSTSDTIPTQDCDNSFIVKVGKQSLQFEPLSQEVHKEAHTLTSISQQQERTSLQIKTLDAAILAAKAQAETQEAILREEQHALQVNIQRQIASMQRGVSNFSPWSGPGEACANWKFGSESVNLGPSPSGTPRGQQENLVSRWPSAGSEKMSSESLVALHSEIANSIEAALSIFAQAPKVQRAAHEQPQPRAKTDLARHMASALSRLDDEPQGWSASGTALDGFERATASPLGRHRPMRSAAGLTTRVAAHAGRSGSSMSPHSKSHELRISGQSPATPPFVARASFLPQANLSTSPLVASRATLSPTTTPGGTPTATPAGSARACVVGDGCQSVVNSIQSALRPSSRSKCSSSPGPNGALPATPRQIVAGRGVSPVSSFEAGGPAGTQVGAFRRTYSRERFGGLASFPPKVATMQPNLSAMVLRRSIPVALSQGA